MQLKVYISFHSSFQNSRWSVSGLASLTFNNQTILQACRCFDIPLIRWFLSSDTADHFRRPHNAQTASNKSISTIVDILPLSSRIRVTSGGTQGPSLDTHEASIGIADIPPRSTLEGLLFDARSLCPMAHAGQRIS